MEHDNLTQGVLFEGVSPETNGRVRVQKVMTTLRTSIAEREGLAMRAKDAGCSINVYCRRMLGLDDYPRR